MKEQIKRSHPAMLQARRGIGPHPRISAAQLRPCSASTLPSATDSGARARMGATDTM